MIEFNSHEWALILGGSSGFGLAAAKKLSKHGMNIFLVHRDRRGAMSRIESEFDEIRKNGIQFQTINTDALSTEGRNQILEKLKESLGNDGKVKLLLHSIAFGNLRPIVDSQKSTAASEAVTKLAEKLGISNDQVTTAVHELLNEGVAPLHTLEDIKYSSSVLEDEDMEQTIYNMGTSLLTWVQKVFQCGFFNSDARVIGLTSEGNSIAWKGYAAVAAAKVALESVSRSIAVEFAPQGIRSNILQPGVTSTPALKLIPGSSRMEASAKLRNPFQRTTQPEDVANVIALLCTDEAAWINGTIIRVDGGEHIASF
ncbi:MAG: SDR family oxidoreductase [Spirochaetes bacterium]|nr:SDR family oxidoreductase [Spirochaetota bacterium]